MSNQLPPLKLNTGASIPVIALGTWESAPEDAYNAVLTAIKAGYRHIDTAMIYLNEEPVGKAIRDSGVPREELFVTTKLWTTDYHDVPAALDASLKRLGLDYVDLYLMHWHFATTKDQKVDNSINFVEAYEAMTKLPKEKARAIGVCNFTIANMEKLLASKPAITPAALQVELHVELPQPRLVEFCQKRGIVVEAYSPLGRGNLGNPKVKKIAEKHNTQPANVVLSWGINRNTVVLPKSVHAERIQSNLEYVKLDAEDIKLLDSIADEGVKRYCDFGTVVGYNTFNDNEDSK